jgi:hypothetical protein
MRWIPHRNGRVITAMIYHRMLGHLKGTDEWFRDYRSGTTSTHWGIGFMSAFDRLIGRAQTRQWVDSNWTAYGWAWRPNDTPTQEARNTLGADLYNPSADLNWQVLHVEVEGLTFSEPWHPAFVTEAKKLEAAIYAAHGPVVRLFHSDCSPKTCPGYWPAAMGPHGAKLFTSVPKPAPPEEDVYEWVRRVRYQDPKKMKIPSGVPVYRAPGQARYAISQGSTVNLIGELLPEDLWVFQSRPTGFGLVRKSQAGRISPL